MLGASDGVVASVAGPRRKLPAERQVSSRLRHVTQQQVTTSCRTFTLSLFSFRFLSRWFVSFFLVVFFRLLFTNVLQSRYTPHAYM